MLCASLSPFLLKLRENWLMWEENKISNEKDDELEDQKSIALSPWLDSVLLSQNAWGTIGWRCLRVSPTIKTK